MAEGCAACLLPVGQVTVRSSSVDMYEYKDFTYARIKFEVLFQGSPGRQAPVVSARGIAFYLARPASLHSSLTKFSEVAPAFPSLAGPTTGFVSELDTPAAYRSYRSREPFPQPAPGSPQY